jgi:hypothetical protein
MEVPIQELLGDFVREANVPAANAGDDAFIKGLVNDVQSGSALLKRDARRMLEKEPFAFFQSACRILKVSLDRPGAASLLEILWSSDLLLNSLIDPNILALDKAREFAKRWVAFDPTLDAKLLRIGFPAEDDDASLEPDLVRPRRTLDIISELPPNRHILLTLAKLLRSSDIGIRSKAALLYSRASNNPDWVRKMLADADERVRANAVEGLWGTKTAAAGLVFKEAALDPEPRVAANALVGLCFCGHTDVDVPAALESMARGLEPATRASAAYAMGRTNAPSGIATLEALLRDADQNVRSQALQALIRIRRREPGPRVAKGPDTPPVEPVQPEPASPPDENTLAAAGKHLKAPTPVRIGRTVREGEASVERWHS